MTNRYEKEIEEILKKAGASPPERQPESAGEPSQESPPKRRRSMLSAQGRATRRIGISYKHLLLAGVGALIASIFVGGLPTFIAGAALLVAGYVMYYRAPRSRGDGGNVTGGGNDSEGGRAPKMWRGRMIDPGDDPHFTDRWGRRQ